MYLATVLSLWVAAMLLCGPRLAVAEWPIVAPRLGLLAWQALLGSSMVATVAAAALWWHDVFEPTLAWLLSVHGSQIDAAYQLPHLSGAWLISAGVGSSVLYVVLTIARELVEQERLRRRHAAGLGLLGGAQRSAVMVLEYDQPAIYCVPGRSRRIVITRGALAVLDTSELAAVLSHEQEHLSARHHWLLVIGRGVHRALPRLRCSQVLAESVERLTEMAADDAAARKHGRQVTASALLKLASGGAPPPATVAATGRSATDVLLRLERLSSEPVLRRSGRWGIFAAVVLVMSTPLFVMLVPAIDVVTRR